MKILALLFLFTSCSGLFYYPTSELYSDPAEHGFKFENHYIESDGHRLHSWLFKTTEENPKGLVILFHGNAQNLTSHYQNLVWLVAHGYDFLIFDYRGYGLSPGSPSQAGLYNDGLRALEFAKKIQEERKAQKLIFYGQSLGGAVLARSMVDSDVKADGVVFDSTFHSYQKIAASKLGPLGFLAYVLVSDEYASTRLLREIKTKAMVIHGTNDNVVPIIFGEEIYNLLGSHDKELVRIGEGEHISAYHTSKTWEFSRQKLLDFLSSL